MMTNSASDKRFTLYIVAHFENTVQNVFPLMLETNILLHLNQMFLKDVM